MVYRGRTRRRARVGRGNTFSKTFGRHGLHHQFAFWCDLELGNSFKDTIVIPLCAMDTTMANADGVYVNPRRGSGNYSTADDHLTYGGSVIKKMHYDMSFMVSPDSDSDCFALHAMTMPICLHRDDLTAEAKGDLLSDFIPVVEHGSDEKLRPNYGGASYILNAPEAYDQDGLSSTIWEGVNFNRLTFTEAISEASISPKILSVTQGGLRSFVARKEHPQWRSGTIRVPKKCQLQTEHTFYGVLVHLDSLMNTTGAKRNASNYLSGDFTTAKMRLRGEFSYYEFNKEFNQGIS